MNNEIATALESYKSVIKESYSAFHGKIKSERSLEMIAKFNDSFSFDVGRKYIKVVIFKKDRSVHSFIVIGKDAKFAYGDILKAASWNAPARNFKRANLFEPESYAEVSWTGIS